MKVSTCFCLSVSSSRSPISPLPAEQNHRTEQIDRRQLLWNALGFLAMKMMRVGASLLVFLALASVAYGAKGLAKLKGQIVVSDQDLPVLEDEEKMVTELK